MERIYRTSFRLGTNDCDMTGGWKASAILNAMQEAAGCHGTQLGFGRNVLDPLGIVWVISRMEVVLDRCAHIGETVTLETFPTMNRRWFFPRFFTIRGEDGTVFGRASTLWLLMDVNTRRMASPDVIRHLIPDNSDLALPMGLPSAAPGIDAEAESYQLHPSYSDLDINMHVNNTRYLDMCCNALGIDLMLKKYISHFTVSYDKEIKADQVITACLRKNGTAFSFTGFEGETRHFDIGGELADR